MFHCLCFNGLQSRIFIAYVLVTKQGDTRRCSQEFAANANAHRSYRHNVMGAPPSCFENYHFTRFANRLHFIKCHSPSKLINIRPWVQVCWIAVCLLFECSSRPWKLACMMYHYDSLGIVRSWWIILHPPGNWQVWQTTVLVYRSKNAYEKVLTSLKLYWIVPFFRSPSHGMN